MLAMDRGSLGGLLGGVLTAYLLGPHIKIEETEYSTTYRDNPPLPLFPDDGRALVHYIITAGEQDRKKT